MISPAVCAQTATDDTGAPPPGPPRRRPTITPIQWVGLAVLVLLLLNQMGLLNSRTGVGGLLNRLPFFVALILAITVHEFSHGFIATLFGDDDLVIGDGKPGLRTYELEQCFIEMVEQAEF